MNNQFDVEQLLERMKDEGVGSAPEFSYSVLLGKIRKAEQEKAPKGLIITAVCCMIVLLSFNISMPKKKYNDHKDMIQEMHLMSNSSIYNG